MKMKVFALMLSLIVAAGCSKVNGNSEIPEEDLESLDKVIFNAAKYTGEFEERIDSVKESLSESHAASEKVRTFVQLAQMYRRNMADSSLYFANEALKISELSGNKNDMYLAGLTFCDALVASGFFGQAIHRYDSLSQYVMPGELRIQFFLTGRRLYSNIRNYVNDRGYMSNYYESKYVECDDSLINLLPDDDNFRKFIIGERMVASGKFSAAKTQLEDLLKTLDIRDDIYGMAAYQLATVYKSDGDMYSYSTYLARAAQSDIIHNVREGYALPSLAAWLYDMEDFSKAFQYINFALEDAYKSNSRVRMVSMAKWVPRIDEAYRRHISRSRNEWFVYAALASLLLVALGIVTFFLLKQTRKSRASQLALSSTSRLKDTYIGNFIGLCSTYSEKYHTLVKLVDRKLSSGQSQELLKTIRSGKFGEAENEVFYNEIDSVVLSLYPDFVDKINELLRPEERIDIQGGKLTPELRIYAFVRLGVSESVRIARILNYSTNTVYAYRNRMRNRALDRENFDDNILKIGI